MMIQQQWIGKAGLVESAVNFHGDNSLAVALDNVDYIKGDIDPEDLALAPFLDRSGTAELPSHVAYDSVVGEAGEERVGVMLIDRPNKGRYRLPYFCFFVRPQSLHSPAAPA